MYKKLIMFLNEMIFDLSTREFFPIFKIWKNESALPIAPAPANSTKAASEASLQFCRAKIASGVQFCFGHKSLWYPELPSNDVATKLQLTSFRVTSRLGAFLGFQANLNGGLIFSANNEEGDNKKPRRWKADNMVFTVAVFTIFTVAES